MMSHLVFFLMCRTPSRSTLTDTLSPDATLFRCVLKGGCCLDWPALVFLRAALLRPRFQAGPAACSMVAPTTLRISPMQPSRWRGRAAATFGAERAAGEGSTNVRTTQAKRCSARRRRTGHAEQGLAPATSDSEERRVGQEGGRA